ncbi:hypothetical protein B0H13DRAFT_2317321 [Mycena leptocephala]|nr:hypothetical protein B0H13DRAFT_2317321 [Mycena leptocephala]
MTTTSIEASLALLVYPVVTLPTEITARIFIECLPTHGRVSPSPSTAPLVLAQICHGWRDIALSTPELWSSIRLDFLSKSRDRAREKKASDGALCLNQGSKDLLSPPLFMEIPSEEPGTYREVPSALLSFMSALATQIQCMEVHILPAQLRQLRPLNTPLPLLRQLTTPHPSDDADLRDLLHDAPALRELRLLGPSSTVNFSLPFLTSLEIDSGLTDLNTFVHILTHFPRLARLKCELRHGTIVYGPAVTTTGELLRHPFLETLALRGADTSLVLNLITLPALHTLEIMYYPLLLVLRSFVACSACALRRLVISMEKFEHPELAAFLAALPALESLQLIMCGDLDGVITCLTPPALLPALRALEIAATRPNVDYAAVLAFLRARPQKLRSCRLAVEDPNPDMKHIACSMGISEQECREAIGGDIFGVGAYVWPPAPADAFMGLIAGGLDLVFALTMRSRDVYVDTCWPDVTVRDASA